VEALIKTVQELFTSQHRYLVPAYQRPYVWTEGKQWGPLWEDIERAADSRLQAEGDEHFLGAIVIRRETTPPGGITEWSVIDGQQRLTTLQVLMSAIAAAARGDGHERVARKLEKLMHHDEDEAEGDSRFKFWPTTANRDAFRAVMQEGGADISKDDPSNTIHEAWTYFRGRAEVYAHTDQPSEGGVLERYEALRETVTGLLQIVTISLDKADPAQVIFETLNARGTPLLEIDLVKNALFDKASHEGIPAQQAYDRYWDEQLGDHAYWSREQRLGRLTVPRSEAFLMHWLVMKLGRVVGADELFSLFRHQVLPKGEALPLLEELNADAGILRSFESLETGSPEGRLIATLDGLDISVFHPVAMLLCRPNVDSDQRAHALKALASFLVRRMLLGLTTKNYNVLAARLVTRIRENPGTPVDEVVIDELTSSDSDTSKWPSDEELRAHLEAHRIYNWIGQKKIVFVLSNVELEERQGKAEGITQLPARLSIEHLMPQTWTTNWGLPDDASEEAVDLRTEHVDRLGNLTLVTGPLNSSMSNAAWDTKREELKKHSLLLLNRSICERPDWDEDRINTRSKELIDRIFAIWPGPDPARLPTHATAESS
jgi:hypothetical protein